MPLEIGQVFSLRCLLCNPPKQKLFVIASLDPLRCLIINSAPSPFQASSPRQLAALAPIMYSEHAGFLSHDSFVDCSGVSFEYKVEDIEHLVERDPNCFKGVLSSNAREKVGIALHENRLIPMRHLAALREFWKPPEV